jgi:hypothetical protein
MSRPPHIAECKQAARRFSLASSALSNTEDVHTIWFTPLPSASKSRPKTPSEILETMYRADFRQVLCPLIFLVVYILMQSQVQDSLVKGDKELALARCIDLINAHNLPADIKIETIQAMSTIVPLDQARCYLEDAIRIATDLSKTEPKEML